jgi:hypothetical protein
MDNINIKNKHNLRVSEDKHVQKGAWESETDVSEKRTEGNCGLERDNVRTRGENCVTDS